MMRTLEQFDKVTAAGILARAALSVDNGLSSEYRLPDEENIRAALLKEAMERRGIDPTDRRPETLERLGEILDAELQALIEPRDTNAVLERLSAKGDLPSDLYTLRVVPQLADIHGERFKSELKMIEETVRSPDREQHYGPHPTMPNDPFLISLFFKNYWHKNPLQSFGMLVGGQRMGLELVVHHAWRVYPSEIPLGGANTLVDVLRLFAEKFGVLITVGRERARFILGGVAPQGVKSIEIDVQGGDPGRGGKRNITMSCFWQHDPTTQIEQASLVTAIDTVKYKRYLKAHSRI